MRLSRAAVQAFLLALAASCAQAVRLLGPSSLFDALTQHWLGRGEGSWAPPPVPPSAVVTGGRIVGDWAADGVARFRGIPFGASTAGPGRWLPPSPAAPWAPDSWDATHWGPACAQGQPRSDPDVPEDQSEDCLNVNVFTPALGRPASSPPVPVLLFFHGCASACGREPPAAGCRGGRHLATGTR